MSIKFTWDKHKAASNEKKHGVTFQEASSVFFDTLSITVPDSLHSIGEERYIIIGNSSQNRLLVVVHTDKGEEIHLISARKATTREKRFYGESDVYSKRF